MLEPSRAFYVAVFGTMKAGAIAVPLFTLFGPDGVKLRVDDCKPRLIVTNAEKAQLLAGIGTEVVVADAAFLNDLQRFAPHFTPDTAADAMALRSAAASSSRLVLTCAMSRPEQSSGSSRPNGVSCPICAALS